MDILEKTTETVYNDVNTVHIRGTIVNKYVVPTKSDTVILTVSTTTLGREIPNYPQITFAGKRKEAADSFPIYTNVDITARVQSSRWERPDGKKIYGQTIIGMSIKESEKTMSEAFENVQGGHYLAPVNQVKFIGTIVSPFKASDNVVSCAIETVINGKHSFNRSSVYCRNADEWIQEHPEGMRVACLGEIQTIKKDKDGKTVHYENIVLKEVQKIS